jgi:hypothetical protein
MYIFDRQAITPRRKMNWTKVFGALICSMGLLLCLTAQAPLAAEMPLVFSCSPENDLYRAMSAGGAHYPRYNNALEAVDKAPPGSGVLILADGYPEKATPVDSTLEYAAKRGLRVYVEYPATLPDLTVEPPRGSRMARAVIVSEEFGPKLGKMRILDMRDCYFVPVKAAKPSIVLARVAGFDTAVYGLPTSGVYPILVELTSGKTLVSSTKLSQFITARYAPAEAWQLVWKRILEWLAPGASIPELKWTPVVQPSFGPKEALPADAELLAFRRGVAWYSKARLLLHPSWRQGGDLEPYFPRSAPMHRSGPLGDGTDGVAEGLLNVVEQDGSQPVSYFLRNDCIGEVTLPFAISSALDGSPQGARIAANLADFIYFRSILAEGPRGDPKSPSFGLVGGGGRRESVDIYYGDDAARSILGTAGAAAVLHSDRWDESLLRFLLAEFRTSGKLGFRSWRLEDHEIQEHGWRYYFDKDTVLYQAHYEAYLWAALLWAYDKTGYRPLLDRTRNGIRMMMAAYPNEWRWTNGLQQERARMLLPLAWMVRVEDTPEHRQWLRRMATDMLASQDESGAIREELGPTGHGDYPPPKTNEAYGTDEAPLIQENGDPVADLLYTTNFAFLGLHEAAAATGDSLYRDAADKLAGFLCRIQGRSEVRPELDGLWFRAFDYHRWEYWGSSADWGYGPLGVETGWGQSWITSVLGMRQMKTSLWQLTSGSGIKQHMNGLLPVMLPQEK